MRICGLNNYLTTVMPGKASVQSERPGRDIVFTKINYTRCRRSALDASFRWHDSIKVFLYALVVLIGILCTNSQAHAQATQAVITDSRIKTFVYNENDVYSLLTHYGYQCNIEFGPKENIETISIGDRVGWQVIPSGRRLFIRAMTENAHTNMTVVTNKRAYQFDMRSSGSEIRPNEELVYVARFFYPEEGSPIQQALIASADLSQALTSTEPRYNYNYSMTGPDSFAPTKIFDDGRFTYFKFAPTQAQSPAILMVKADGQELPLTARTANGYLVVPVVSKRFSLRQGQDVICIYNEAPGAPL